MGVPGADDIMLHYQSTSFHDALYLRRILNLRPARVRSLARLQRTPPPDSPLTPPPLTKIHRIHY
jgi:hypothetical protein